jgi:hypothetical protein
MEGRFLHRICIRWHEIDIANNMHSSQTWSFASEFGEKAGKNSEPFAGQSLLCSSLVIAQ